MNTIEAKYRSAVAFIHQLVSQLRSHVPAADIEEPPIDIESALKELLTGHEHRERSRENFPYYSPRALQLVDSVVRKVSHPF